jgi:hypothetical protein
LDAALGEINALPFHVRPPMAVPILVSTEGNP